MVKEYWERIDKEIKDAMFRAVLLTWSGNPEYAKVPGQLMALLESERERLGIKRVKRSTSNK